ncbi:MAG: hypothetical protein ABGY41_07650 [Candidatus Poribacteria bacterium]
MFRSLFRRKSKPSQTKPEQDSQDVESQEEPAGEIGAESNEPAQMPPQGDPAAGDDPDPDPDADAEEDPDDDDGVEAEDEQAAFVDEAEAAPSVVVGQTLFANAMATPTCAGARRRPALSS